MGDTMLRRSGEAIVRSDLHDPTNVTKCLPIRMVHFKEMNARDMSKMAARSKGKDAEYTLVEYDTLIYAIFVLIYENYRALIMARFSLSQDDITESECSSSFDFVT